MRRRRPLPAALLAIVALVSACGSSPPTGTGASTTAGASASAGKSLAHAQKAVKFAQCMRRNGVGTFPDPSASGKLTIDAIANGSSVNTSTPAFEQAISACKALEPAGFTGGTRSAAQQSGALRFAQCIREHGVKDFPDPVNAAPLVDTNRIPSSDSPSGMSILNAAMRKCGGFVAAAGVTR
jgi:hypothetical protein